MSKKSLDNIIISMESTCDLSKEIIAENDFRIIYMDFMIDGVVYSSSEHDVVSTNLYQKMKDGAKTSTSQLNEQRYIDFFTDLLKEGKDVMHIAFSSGLSATYSSAMLASEKVNKQFKNKVYVVDSKCACGGHGVLGLLAKDYAKEHNVIELGKYLEQMKYSVAHLFSVDNLKYLANGGRIKKSSATIGNILNIKPVMNVDNEGHLIVLEKVMARRKALRSMLDKFNETYDGNYKFCIINHADCYQDAEFICKNIKENKGINPIITNLGPVIGSHSGPGTITIFYVSKCGR
jgi:DegV family protein with EDD domain